MASIVLVNLSGIDDRAVAVRRVLESSSFPDIESIDEPLFSEGSRLYHAAVGRIVADSRPDAVILIVSFPPLVERRRWLTNLREGAPSIPVLVLYEGDDYRCWADLLQGITAEFLRIPVDGPLLLRRLNTLLEKAAEEEQAVHRLKQKMGLRQLIGESPVFVAQLKKIPRLAQSDSCVLISGETGTGKELVARAIHYIGPRSCKPFVPVNCGAIPEELAESELFGHERGAFTGAVARQTGLIQEAEGGSIFLDDVDCLSLDLQAKLLRFLQEKEYRLLGSPRTQIADVRVMSATNRDLTEAVEEKSFRLDLYYRLNVVPLHLPPLRERVEDILPLARHFLQKFCREFEKRIDGFTSGARQRLLEYSWPGNVRELENVMERGALMCDEELLDIGDLQLHPGKEQRRQESFQEAKARVVIQFERGYIQRLLTAYQGNISRAAKAAKKNRRAFWELIRKHGIDVRRFKSP